MLLTFPPTDPFPASLITPFTIRAAGGRRSRYTVRAHFTLVTHARSVGSAEGMVKGSEAGRVDMGGWAVNGE